MVADLKQRNAELRHLVLCGESLLNKLEQANRKSVAELGKFRDSVESEVKIWTKSFVDIVDNEDYDPGDGNLATQKVSPALVARLWELDGAISVVWSKIVALTRSSEVSL